MPTALATLHLPDLGLTRLGRVQPRHARQITASRLGVGFECLDRKMFDPEQAFHHVGALGVKWARVQTGWSRCETVEGQYDFAWLDRIVETLMDQGVQPWFNLTYGNQLYTPEAPSSDAVGWPPIFTERARAAWQRYVEALAAHFAGRVQHWEVWNEANASNFWKPRASNAEDYAELVRLSVEPIRRHVVDAFLIGGVVCTGLRARTLRFIEDMLQTGVGQQLDAISYYPYYRNPDDGDANQFAALRAMVHRHNPRLQFWQGESGGHNRPSDRGAMHGEAWSETVHARWIARRVLNDLRNGVDHSSYFSMCSFANYVLDGAEGKAQHTSLLTAGDYRPTEGYHTYQALCSLFDHDTQPDERVTMFAPGHDRDASPPQVELTELRRRALRWVGFVRHGKPLWAIWLPTDVFQPPEPETMTLALWHPLDASPSEPVLIDPINQSVYALPLQDAEPGLRHTPPLPVGAAPLIVADRTALRIDH